MCVLQLNKKNAQTTVPLSVSSAPRVVSSAKSSAKVSATRHSVEPRADSYFAVYYYDYHYYYSTA